MVLLSWARAMQKCVLCACLLCVVLALLAVLWKALRYASACSFFHCVRRYESEKNTTVDRKYARRPRLDILDCLLTYIKYPILKVKFYLDASNTTGLWLMVLIVYWERERSHFHLLLLWASLCFSVFFCCLLQNKNGSASCDLLLAAAAAGAAAAANALKVFFLERTWPD